LRCLVREAAASRKRAPALAPPLPNRFGDYEILGEIGRGGMGRVYRARQISLDRIVALKVISAGEMSSSNLVDRFRTEAEAAASLDHPNIVSIHEVGEHEGWNFFSMRLIEGRTLGQALADGLFPFERTARLLTTVARAIQHAHERGVLHRDLKPGNILLDAADEPHVTDFGLAKFTQRLSDLTLSHTALGTPAYMSPEQAAGRVKEITTASDIYGLGAVMFELLTGAPPFLGDTPLAIARAVIDQEARTPSAVNPSVPLDLAVICLKCLEKDPARRYPSAAALADDLERWTRHEPIEARRIGVWGRTLRWARRQPKLAAMILATALAVAAFLATLALADVRIRSAHKATQIAAEENRQRLVKLNVLTGNRLVSQGDNFAGLLWFAEAWRLDRGLAAREIIHRRRFAATLRGTPILVKQWIHDGFVNSAEFSPDGTQIVTASLDKTARVWSAFTGEPVGPPLNHDGVVWSAVFTPDGRRVVTGSGDGKLRYWDIKTGQLTREPLPTAISEINFDNFSPDGRWLAAPTRGAVRFFEASNGEPTSLTFTTRGIFDKAQFSKDGRWLAAFGGSPGVCFWEVATGQRVFESAPIVEEVRMLRFNPNSHSVVLNRGFRLVDLRDLETGASLWPPVEPGGDLYDCQFSPDGSRLATASWNGAVRLFETETGRALGPPLQHQAGVRSSVFSPDGHMLATASWDGTARLWNTASGAPISPALHHAGYVASVRFSPSTPQLLTASQDGTVRLWEFATNGPARLIVRHAGAVRQARFSPGGERFLTCGEDKRACIWDTASGRLLLFHQHSSSVASADFSPKGDRVATGCSDGSVHVWDTRAGEETTAPLKHSKWIRCVRFSPDGQKLLTASDDGTARIWDVESGAPITENLIHRGPICRAFFSRDGRSVVTASFDHTAQVWNANTGEQIGVPFVHSSEVHIAAFSPDGTKVVTAMSDETQLPRSAQVWDVASGKKVGPPLPHRDGIIHVEFSPDGRFIATGSKDMTAIIWDASLGKPIAPPLRHLSYLGGASFSPDSQLILTTSHDGTARIWEAMSGEPITPPLVHENILSEGTWRPDGQEILTSSYDGSARIWDISPSSEPLQTLNLRAELLSASRLDPEIGPISLTAQEMNQRWQTLRHSDQERMR
jgi:WD40 repeat protein